MDPILTFTNLALDTDPRNILSTVFPTTFPMPGQEFGIMNDGDDDTEEYISRDGESPSYYNTSPSSTTVTTGYDSDDTKKEEEGDEPMPEMAWGKEEEKGEFYTARLRPRRKAATTVTPAKVVAVNAPESSEENGDDNDDDNEDEDNDDEDDDDSFTPPSPKRRSHHHSGTTGRRIPFDTVNRWLIEGVIPHAGKMVVFDTRTNGDAGTATRSGGRRGCRIYCDTKVIDSLLPLPTKKFNRKVKSMKLSTEEVNELKFARRRIKNTRAAQKRRIVVKDKTTTDTAKIKELEARVVELEARVKELEAQNAALKKRA